MADPYGTEEEQIRAIKQWWAENGASTVAGVVLAVAIVLGWRWWQDSQAAHAAQGAAMYEQLRSAIQASPDDPVQRATAAHLASELAENYAGERYGDYGQLMSARLAVTDGDLATAEAALTALIANASDPISADTARLRLGRVLLALDQPDRALAAIGEQNRFEVQAHELRGDILRQLNDRDGALAAYQAAADAAGGGQVTQGVLGLKINELETMPEGVTLSEYAASEAEVGSETGAVETPPVAPAEMQQATDGESVDEQ